MAAPPERRPHRVLASLIEKLEATKPKAGLVDPATDFAVCRQFALSVYARADRNDVNASGTSNAPPTRTQVEAFSAAGTFLAALDQSSFAGMCDDDIRARRDYAEWRAWDLATAMHAGRQPSPVNGHGGGSSPKETVGIDAFTPPPPAAPPAPPAPERPAVSQIESRIESLAVSPPPRTAAPRSTPEPPPSAAPLPPPPPPPPGHRSPSVDSPSPRTSEDPRWEPRWGNSGAPHREDDEVLYKEREGGYKLARVLKVDTSVDPPGYVVEVDGAERSTEAGRLAPAPAPRRRGDGGDDGGGGGSGSTGDGSGSDGDGCVDASAAFAPPSRSGCRGGAEGVPSDAHVPSRSDMALAHESAMEAAQCLDPSRGDHEDALEFLRRAMDALERRR